MGHALRLVETVPACKRLIFGSALVRRLIDCASRNTGIPPEHITSSWRDRDLVWIRWAIFLVARERGRTLPLIADCFGKDHTTIIHGLRRAAKLTDSEFLRLVDILRRESGSYTLGTVSSMDGAAG